MTLAELRDEYASVRIGPKIYAEVGHVVRAVARRHDPNIYAGAASWDDAEEETLHNVIKDVLLLERQLDYLMATALTLDDFKNLLRRQVRRYLARRRQRSVIDNLLDRCKPLLGDESFEHLDGRTGRRYRLRGRPPSSAEPSDEELLAAARSASIVPRVRFTSQERAPVVYSRDSLLVLLKIVANSLPATFAVRDIDKVFRLLLTDWVTSFLMEYEEDQSRLSETILSPEDEVIVTEAVAEIVARCNREHLLILWRKLENRPDQAIAEELDISRPTVIVRKREVFKIVEDALDDVPTQVHSVVMDRLSLRVAIASLSGTE
jgi:hypothetical protein